MGAPPLSVRLLLGKLLAFAVLAFCFLDVAEAKRKINKGKNFDRALFVLKWIWLAVFGPVVLYFVYSVVRDPMTPHLLYELWCRAKEKTGSFLGRTQGNGSARSSKRGGGGGGGGKGARRAGRGEGKLRHRRERRAAPAEV